MSTCLERKSYGYLKTVFNYVIVSRWMFWIGFYSVLFRANTKTNIQSRTMQIVWKSMICIEQD